MNPVKDQVAQSPVIGGILLVSITIILAVLVMVMMLSLINFPFPQNIPETIKIERLALTDENGRLNYDSRVFLVHTGTEIFQNNDLRAEIYKNGVKLPVIIRTFHGHEFVSTSHFGIQTMAGLGCSGETWYPGEKVVLDLNDGTFRSGDLIRVDIFRISINTIISRHSLRA